MHICLTKTKFKNLSIQISGLPVFLAYCRPQICQTAKNNFHNNSITVNLSVLELKFQRKEPIFWFAFTICGTRKVFSFLIADIRLFSRKLFFLLSPHKISYNFHEIYQCPPQIPHGDWCNSLPIHLKARTLHPYNRIIYESH